MSKHTQLQARTSNGDHVQLTAHDTDSPVLPVPQLQALHDFRPDLVNWVTEQTEKEATHRRKRQDRVDLYVFLERILGQVAGAGIAALGLGVAAYTAINGHEWVAGVLGGGTLVTIVTVLVGGKPKSEGKAASKEAEQPTSKAAKR